MKLTKKALCIFLAALMLLSCAAVSASAYSRIQNTDAYLAKTGETVDMIAFYKANRYGASGANQFYNLKTVTITDKGDTYASVSGTKVKFPQGGKAVVKLNAQYIVAKTGKIVDDVVSYTFYVSSGSDYILIFEPNGGSGKAAVYSGNATVLAGYQPKYTRSGYTLDGWTRTPTGQMEFTGNISASKSIPVVLYAHWKPNTYTLSFNANGGSVSPASKSVTYGSTFGTLPTPTRAGYRFDGWYGTATGGGQFTSSSLYSFPQNLTIFAHWTKLTEIKSVDITGVVAPVVGAAPVKTGYKISSNVTVKSFNWTNKIGGGNYATTTDATFQDGKDYAVSFQLTPNEGYAFAAAGSMKATVNGKTATFTNPQQGVYYVRYVFGAPAKTVSSVMITGVSEPTYGGKVTTSGIKASAGFEITNSYWTKKQSNGTYQTTTDTTFQRGGEYGLNISGKIASGYVVSGTLSISVGSKKATVKHNGGEYYAASCYYNPVTQSVWVTFDPDGGTLADSEKTKIVTVGSAYGALPTPTKSGLSFDGWYDGSTKITSTSKVQRTENHTLKAHWKDKTPTNVAVTFDPNGGTIGDSQKTKIITVGNPYGALPVPTRTGYTFEGWFNAANNQITAATTVTVSSNHTLTAKWKKVEPKTVTVTFDATPGLVGEHSKTVTVGEKYGLLPIASRGGYKFLGWYDDADVHITSVSVVEKTTDHTLKAKWESTAAPHTEHTYDAGTVTKDPTCTAVGETTFTCTVCGATKTEEIPMKPHTFDAGTVIKEATCTATGEKTLKCTVCGLTKTEVIPKAPHTYTDAVVTKEATCTATGEKSFTCSVCGGSYVEVIPMTGHSFVESTTPATLKKSGEVVGTCSVCGETQQLAVIYRPKTYTLSANRFTYNGKAKTPSVTVTDAKGNLIEPESYELTYANNKDVGVAKVKITFKGDYSGTKTVKFKILPKKTGLKKLTAGSGAFKAVWKEIKSGDGYQLQYATNKSFKNAKTVTINDSTVTAKTIKKLLSGKTYFVRVRTVKLVGEKPFYAEWGKIKKVKTK